MPHQNASGAHTTCVRPCV